MTPNGLDVDFEALSRVWVVMPLGLLFGLGLANQQSLILLAPLPPWVAW